MTKKSTGGFTRHMTDKQRAKLRGKGHEPDYAAGSDEGLRLMGEAGRGDTTSLRGHTTGGTTQVNIEKDKSRFNEPTRRW